MRERKYLKQVDDVALMRFNRSGATLNAVVQLLDDDDDTFFFLFNTT